MTRIAGAIWPTVALLGASAAFAQQPSTPPTLPPMDMPMTPDEMRQMGGAEQVGQPAHETHAPDPSLERPALSQANTAPMMPGMDTDMKDATLAHRVWVENLEGLRGTENGGAWDAQAWTGGDFDKLWIKSEGATLGGRTQDSKVEALWAHAILPFWDTQLGVRQDFSGGPGRGWAAFGLQGTLPYWFDFELTGYVGEEGRTAARVKTEYDLYLTQRLVLKPEIELNAYGKPDRARQIGAGLSDGQFELRLRYELSRRFAPYVGFVYDQRFAGSATLARLAGEPAIDHRTVAGVDFFF
jgi:copper resistance protein B